MECGFSVMRAYVSTVPPTTAKPRVVQIHQVPTWIVPDRCSETVLVSPGRITTCVLASTDPSRCATTTCDPGASDASSGVRPTGRPSIEDDGAVARDLDVQAPFSNGGLELDVDPRRPPPGGGHLPSIGNEALARDGDDHLAGVDPNGGDGRRADARSADGHVGAVDLAPDLERRDVREELRGELRQPRDALAHRERRVDLEARQRVERLGIPSEGLVRLALLQEQVDRRHGAYDCRYACSASS